MITAINNNTWPKPVCHGLSSTPRHRSIASTDSKPNARLLRCPATKRSRRRPLTRRTRRTINRENSIRSVTSADTPPSLIETFGLAKSSQDDDLAARFVLLHAAVRLDDVVELEHLTDLHPQRARGNLLDQFIERCQHEILGPAIIGGQAHGSRDHVHRAKVVERPFVAHHSRHANDPTLLGAAERVRQRLALAASHFHGGDYSQQNIGLTVGPDVACLVCLERWARNAQDGRPIPVMEFGLRRHFGWRATGGSSYTAMPTSWCRR